MSTTKYSFGVSNIKDFPFDNYEKDFTFIVNNKRYQTSRIVADLLSPTIKKNHYNDSNNNEFIINTSETTDQSNDYFLDFLQLVIFEEKELSSTQRELYCEYFLELGNIDEYFKLKYYEMTDITEPTEPTELTERDINRSLQILTDISELSTKKEININESILYEHIKNISSVFSKVSKSELNKLEYSIIEQIIKSEHLTIYEEDEVCEFIIDKYCQDHQYSSLFEYVLFCNVSEEVLSRFFDEIEFEDINLHIWKSLCCKYSRKDKERNNIDEQITRYNKENKSYQNIKTKNTANERTFEYERGQEFEGIMKYLTTQSCGNIHDNGTIEITTNNLYDGCHPKNLVDYSNNNHYDPSDGNKNNSFVCFDFKDKLVQLTKYSIKSYTQRYLKNWCIEVSEDGHQWETIDRHENDSNLKGEYKVAVFNISPERNEFYRFIRLVETGCHWGSSNCYDGDFCNLEFFGRLQQPHQ